MKYKLKCKSYTVERDCSNPTTITPVFFVALSPNASKEQAELLLRIEEFLTGPEGIDLVRAVDGKQRCFCCGVLNEEAANICTQCGAPL
jgi:hypothetical protein